MSAQTVGHPDWKLKGTITLDGKTNDLKGTLVQDPTDRTKFDLQDTTWGMFTWSSPNQLKEEFRGPNSILTGTVEQSDGKNVYSYQARITVNVDPNDKNYGKVTSSFEQITPKPPPE
jgi:hypothetical protein